MKKGMLIVGSVSGVTLILFGVFTYLMVNVNPRPLVVKTTTPASAPVVQRKAMVAIGRASMAPAVTCTRSSTTPAHDKVASVLLAKAQMMNEENDTEATTRPQMRVFPNKVFLNVTVSTLTTEKTSGKLGAKVTKVPPRPTVKGFKRRSLRDRKRKTAVEESFLLKIMDDKGSPRIEIKLPGNAEINKTRLRIVSRPQGGGDLKIYKQQKYRVIKLMPNNTFVFENEDVPTDNKTHLNVTTPNTRVLPVTPVETTMHSVIFDNDSKTTNYKNEKKRENTPEIEKKVNKEDGINNKEDLNDRDLLPIPELIENTNNSNFIGGTSKNNFITILTTNFTDAPKDLKQIKRVLHVYPSKTTKSYQKVTDFNVPIVDSVFDKSKTADEIVSTMYPMTPNQIQYTAFNETMTQYPNTDLHPYIPVQFFNTQTVDVRRDASEEPEEATLSLEKKLPTDQPR